MYFVFRNKIYVFEYCEYQKEIEIESTAEIQ